MLTRPARDVSPEDVVNAVEEGMRKTGYNEFSLLSLSCSDYLVRGLAKTGSDTKLEAAPVCPVREVAGLRFGPFIQHCEASSKSRTQT